MLKTGTKFIHLLGWRAIIGGAVAAFLTALSRLLIGTVYSQAGAIEFINALSQSGLYLGAAIATSSATILALMLTLLGITRKVDKDFDANVYRRINAVGMMSTICLCGAMFLLLLLTLPVGEFKEMPSRWYPIMYDSLIGLVGFLTALLVTTVLLLFGILRSVVAKITPADDV